MHHHLFIGRFDTVVEVEVWDIRPDKNQIIFMVAGNVFANVTGTIRTINKNQKKKSLRLGLTSRRKELLVLAAICSNSVFICIIYIKMLFEGKLVC